MEAVLAMSDVEFEEEEEDELAPVAGSPMNAELGESSKQVEPEARDGDVAIDARNKEVVEPVVSQEVITKE